VGSSKKELVSASQTSQALEHMFERFVRLNDEEVVLVHKSDFRNLVGAITFAKINLRQ
jgi:chemotaxis protein CheY-P-specific phosphatase CheC